MGEIVWLGTRAFSYAFAVVFGVAIVAVIAYDQIARWLDDRRQR
jgi:hypothetical protein